MKEALDRMLGVEKGIAELITEYKEMRDSRTSQEFREIDAAKVRGMEMALGIVQEEIELLRSKA